MRRICVVTGSRADWGLLEPVYWRLKETESVDLVAAWNCPEYDCRINIENGDTELEIAEATAQYLAHFASRYAEHRPDIVLLLGDRYEVFAAATAALIARIPIAHIHGGESTEGAFDEALRHSITKMSHLHFVATAAYRKRVIQLGEHPGRVFNAGGLGVDSVLSAPLFSRKQVSQEIGFDLGDGALLVVFHPATLSSSSDEDAQELLAALRHLPLRLIFLMPNADTGSYRIRGLINEFVGTSDNAIAFENLPQSLYLELLRNCDGIVGNSSSGLLEAPSLRKGCINIGDRQKGRIMGMNVINCAPTREAITNAIKTLYSPEFQESLKSVVNPYGEGGAVEKIVQVLREHPLDNIIKKSFYDL